MDRIYQVFVSSTFVDLQEERQAVVTALLELEAIPAGMELFPAADDDAWTLIEQVISGCDYYLLVIGGRYGSVDSETELSFTEREYDFAVAQGKPVMAFLHGDPDKIEYGKSEQAAPEKLQAFRKKVESSKHVKYWTSPEDLAGKVARSFATFRKNYAASGWVRGDQATSSESLKELNSLRKELEETRAELETAQTKPPPGASDLSQGGEGISFPLAARGLASDYSPKKATFQASATWDELFSKLGPLLLDECEEEAMRSRLNNYFRIRRKEEAEEALAEGENDRPFSNLKVTLHLDTFGTLMVQFKALGLIEKSNRKRSVSDTKTYWTLTPYGDRHLTSLRAIPRGSGTSSVQTKEEGPEKETEAIDEDSSSGPISEKERETSAVAALKSSDAREKRPEDAEG
jgi:hypothetical protein